MLAMRTLFLAATLIYSLHSYGIKTPGTIIANGTSRDVTFDIKLPLVGGEPSFEGLQYKVPYFDEEGKRRTLRPDDADEIRFKLGGIGIRMISCEKTLGVGNILSTASRIFLLLELDGAIRTYRYYSTENNPVTFGGAGGPFTQNSVNTPLFEDKLILQKGNGPLTQPQGLGWKKQVMELFDDCPALTELIEGKEMRREDIETMVLYYNKSCGENSE